MKRLYIGLASTFHDSAIAIVNASGEVLFAEATERRLQYKRALNCPPDNFDVKSILAEYGEDHCHYVVGLSWSDDFTQFARRLQSGGFFDEGAVFPPSYDANSKYLFSKRSILDVFKLQCRFSETIGTGVGVALRSLFPHSSFEIRRFEHHLCHASFGAWASSHERAAVLVVDGFGERGSISGFHFSDDRLSEVYRSRRPASLGWYYEFLTQLCGFDWFTGEEWKVMGLAPYGKYQGHLYDLLSELVRVKDGLPQFAPVQRLREIVAELHSYSRPKGSSPWEAADMAYNGQLVYAEIMKQVLDEFHGRCPEPTLILTGGCGLNSSYNGTVTETTPFREVFVPSAPADDGNAVGAAWLALKQDFPDQALQNGKTLSPYLGSSVNLGTIQRMREFSGLQVQRFPLSVHKETAKRLAEGKLCGWVQGRAEFGPRSLGNRSILADPRPAGMKDAINARVKFREEFRPFAPSILQEYGDDYFENYQDTPYMERTLRFRESKKETVPAVVHANQTGRLQSVSKEMNPSYHRLIEEFHKITGVPILLNTSLNVMGKPIVHSVEDVISLFFTTGLDFVVIGDYLIEKGA